MAAREPNDAPLCMVGIGEANASCKWGNITAAQAAAG